MGALEGQSYYAATAASPITHIPLRGKTATDVCVIGGGYTGLSAALHLAERGYGVVLLEAGSLGGGASGRNGGQLGSGQRLEQAELQARLGLPLARQLWDLAEEAKTLVHTRIARHAIACEWQPGQLIVAAKRGHVDLLKRRTESLTRQYGYPHAQFIAAPELCRFLDTRAFFGGLLDSGAGHLHPLKYALGLARACAAAGVRLHENSRVLHYRHQRAFQVTTATGSVESAYLVFACNGYLENLEPKLAQRLLPVQSLMIATAPLGESRARALMAEPVCVHDTRFVVRYFRRSMDHRLIFGGGEGVRRQGSADIAPRVWPHLLSVFPQLKSMAVDYAWSGTLGLTRSRLPDLGRLGPAGYYAQGFSGHGIGIATLAGQLIAEAVAGTAERFDVMAALPKSKLPGGRLLRTPLLALALVYFTLRDRL